MGTDEKQICSLALERLLQVRVLLGGRGVQLWYQHIPCRCFSPWVGAQWGTEMGKLGAREVGWRDQWKEELGEPGWGMRCPWD